MKKVFLLAVGFLLVVSASVFAMTPEEKAYIKNIEIFDQKVDLKSQSKTGGYIDVIFKMRNNGNKELKSIMVKVFYLDPEGEVMRVGNLRPLDGGSNNYRAPFVPNALWEIIGISYAYSSFFNDFSKFGSVELEVAEVGAT